MGKKTKYGGKKKDDAGGAVVQPRVKPLLLQLSRQYSTVLATQGGGGTQSKTHQLLPQDYSTLYVTQGSDSTQNYHLPLTLDIVHRIPLYVNVFYAGMYETHHYWSIFCTSG